eukprot:163781_1
MAEHDDAPSGNTETIANDNDVTSEIADASKAEEEEEKEEKYKASVVINGTTSTIIESENMVHETNNDKKEPIVIGESSGTIPSNNESQNVRKCENAMILNPVPIPPSVDHDNTVKMIGQNVIRTDKIESLIEKMSSYQNQSTNNRNPVTNTFSTYYERNESIGGELLQSEQIANKYIDKDITNETATATAIIRQTHSRSSYRLDQQNSKRAKKYTAPTDELTRVQIREDIRKMRNPNMHQIKSTLKAIGLKEFMNHGAYIELYDSGSEKQQNANEVQFIAKRKRKKRKHRNYESYDYAYDYGEYYHNSNNLNNGYQLQQNNNNNSVFSISSETNINHEQAQPLQPQPQPLKKKQKMNNHEPIKCNQCNKIFTLEVDLLLHRTNDKC